MIGTIIMSSLQIIAQAAPGFLAAFSGKANDQEALDHAQHAIDRIPQSPAHSKIEAWREHLEATKRS